MARLPTPGQDAGSWGDILNDFLLQSLNSSGQLKANSVTSNALAPGSVTSAALATDAVTSAALGQNAVSVANLNTNNTPSTNQVLAYDGSAMAWTSPTTVTDATNSAKGIVQLAGDLGGTAANPTVPGLAAKEATITAGTTGQYWRGDKTWQTHDKTSVGLGNVDNTSDTSKNSATATLTNKTISGASNTLSNIPQSAVTSLTTDLSAKAPTASPTFSGTVTVPTPVNASDASTKGYIDSLITGGTFADATTTTKGKVQLAGDLGGTAAAPSVTKLNGVSVSGTPAAGKILVATSATAAVWSDVLPATVTASLASSWTPSTGRAFITVPLQSAASGWDNGTSTYTVPVSGAYMCVGKFRLADSANFVQNIGIGIHTSNVDHPSLQWDAKTGGTSPQRLTWPYIRIDNFTANQQLRYYAYFDATSGLPTVITAEINIQLLK